MYKEYFVALALSGVIFFIGFVAGRDIPVGPSHSDSPICVVKNCVAYVN